MVQPLLQFSIDCGAELQQPSEHHRRDPAAASYRVPALLRPVHALNLLELTDSQQATARVLAVHQSSVSRILQGLREQLQLDSPAPKALNHGHSASLGHLRLAARAHRNQAGWLQFTADGLHHPLLRRCPAVLSHPAGFDNGVRLLELVRLAVVDGALMSSFTWGSAVDPPPTRGGQIAWRLGEGPWLLAAASPHPRAVLVPPRSAAPGLHAALASMDLPLEVPGHALPDGQAWLRHAREQALAVPVGPSLTPAWARSQRLRLLRPPQPLRQTLWLIVSDDLPAALVQSVLIRLRRRCACLGRGPSGVGDLVRLRELSLG